MLESLGSSINNRSEIISKFLLGLIKFQYQFMLETHGECS